MALRIVTASTPIKVERLNVCIYGQPGVGKTSMAFTAEKPLLLDFDRGAHRAAGRKDTVQVATWEDVANISAADVKDYRTLVVDTAGRALDCLTADIIRRDAKAGRGGALSLQGYGKLKAEFGAWLRMINSFGLDVVLLTHMDEQKNGDEVTERLDVQGGSKAEVYKAADAMGRIVLRSGVRTLLFDPSDAAFGKNPGQLAPLVVPHPDKDGAFLAGVITSIKDKLNALTEDQVKAQAELNEWRERIALLINAEDINGTLPHVKAASKAAQALLAERAKKLGLTWDKDAGCYAAKAAA